MAFVSDASPDQQNQNQTPGQNPLSQQAPITSAPNASSAKGATGQPSNASPAQPFTNLSSYLTANAPQIQAEGAQIAGGLTQQYGQVTGAIDQAGTNFNNQVNAAYTPLNQGVLDSFSANPTAVANDPTQAKTFTGMYGDTYTGPTSFESTPDYLDLSGKVQGAVSNAQNLQTPAGIQGYFSASSPTYTQGMGTLDAALLQANPQVAQGIEAAAKPFEGLPGHLTSAVLSGNAAAQSANQQAQAAKAAAQNALTGKSDALTARTGNELSTAQDAYTRAVQAYQDRYNALNVSAQNIAPAFLSGSGVDPRLISALGDVASYNDANPGGAINLPNGTNYLSGTPTFTPPSQGSVLTQDDVAMSRALALLSGGAVDHGYTAPGNYTLPARSSIDQGALGNALYNIIANTQPSSVSPGSVSRYQGAMGNLQSYLGMPITTPPDVAIAPPPVVGGGGVHSGGGYGSGLLGNV